MISLFLPSFAGGGAERVMLSVARNLFERGYATHLVVADPEGPLRSLVPAELPVVNLGAPRVLRALPALIRYLRQFEPEVLMSTLDHANLVAIWARQFAHVQTRLVIREANVLSEDIRQSSYWRERAIPFLVRKFYRHAELVVAVSQGVAKDLMHYGVHSTHIRVIYNPVLGRSLDELANESLEDPWIAETEQPIVLGVGRLSKQKDFATLVQAFSIVRKQWPARLLILGEGEQRGYLETLVGELGLTDSVRLPGFVNNPISYMRHSKVFVLSSIYEGLPGTLIQSLAVGCRIVSTDCESGPREILKDGRFGQLVPMRDPEAMARAILSQLAQAVDDSSDSEVESHLSQFSESVSMEQYLEALLHEKSRAPEANTWRNRL